MHYETVQPLFREGTDGYQRVHFIGLSVQQQNNQLARWVTGHYIETEFLANAIAVSSFRACSHGFGVGRSWRREPMPSCAMCISEGAL